MGRFRHDFKGYEDFDDSDCYRKSVPLGLPQAVAVAFGNACGERGQDASIDLMTRIADELRSLAGQKPTPNWEHGALIATLKATLQILAEQRFDKFMDAVLKAAVMILAARKKHEEDFVEKLNHLFAGVNFGYSLQAVSGTESLAWAAVTAASEGIGALDELGQELGGSCEMALQHLRQAKVHLQDPSQSRSRKDALRDVMSALESAMKQFGQSPDFDEAYKKIRTDSAWGPPELVKDGDSMWRLLHRIHSDLRHGQTSGTDLSLEETLYWIDRIAAYLKYMSARKRVLGR